MADLVRGPGRDLVAAPAPARREAITAAVLSLPALGGVDLDDRYGVHRLTVLWLESKADSTATDYRRDLNRWLTWCDAQGLNPLQARGADTDQFLADLAGGFKESSRARYVASLSSWYKYLIRNEVAIRNPIEGAGRPKVDPDASPTIGLSREEAARFLQASGRDKQNPARTEALLGLLLTEGLRVSEATNADVDQLGWDKGYRIITVVRKGGKERSYPLEPSVSAAIDTYLGERSAGPLFITGTGKRMDRWAVTKLIRRIAKAAKIPSWSKLTPHSLRHSFITLSLDAGAALRDVQDAAGHADPRTTRRYDRGRGSYARHPSSRLVAYLDVVDHD